jgi:hypothetical protein
MVRASMCEQKRYGAITPAFVRIVDNRLYPVPPSPQHTRLRRTSIMLGHKND